MPFTGSTFSRLYSWVTDRDANINILATKMDDEMDGFASGLNQIVAGTIPFTGALKGTGGTASAPAFSFSNDANTGMYRVSSDTLGFAVNGSQALRLTTSYVTASYALNLDLSGNVLDGNGNHGAFIKSFTPTVTLIDKTSGAGSSQIQFQNDTLLIIGDTDADELIGSTANESDETWITLSTSLFQYKGATIWHADNDGSGSGLDADLLDGQQGSYYTDVSNLSGTISSTNLPDDILVDAISKKNAGGFIEFHNTPACTTRLLSFDVQGATVLDDYIQFGSATNQYIFYSGADERGATLRAGGCNLNTGIFNTSVTVSGVSVRDAAILNTGTISDARLPSSISSDITGNAATATNSTNLDGQNSAYYRNASNLNAGTIPDARLPSDVPFESTGTWTPAITNVTLGSTVPINSYVRREYVKIGDLCHVNVLLNMGNSPADDEVRMTLPFNANNLQLVGQCWLSLDDAAPSYDSSTEADAHLTTAGVPQGNLYHGNAIVKDGYLYFKTDSYTSVGSFSVDQYWLYLSFTYRTT